MAKLIKIESNYPNDMLRIELFLGNSCNYKCWYCVPKFNDGSAPWPKLDTILDNLGHLITHYRKTTNKKRVNLYIIGGEPTLWKDFSTFIQYFKTTHDCIISISTNGSRTVRWWNDYGHHLDHVMISCHHERVDINHIVKVADILYSKNVTVNAMVLMDPNHWDKCVSYIEQLKYSQHRYLITALEILGDTIKYSSEQLAYISKSIKRYPELNFYLRNGKTPRNKPMTYYEDGTSKQVNQNYILLNKLNFFYGWTCNIGVDTFYIDTMGNIRGACGQSLYDMKSMYNIYDKDFKEKFNPTIRPITCKNLNACTCHPEANTSKYQTKDLDNGISAAQVQ